MKKPTAAVTVSFDVDQKAAELIRQLVERAFRDVPQVKRLTTIDLVMTLEACHANGNPLRLADLLKVDAFNFTHDIVGIYNNLDRNTGKLLNCFSPRYSARKRS